VALLRDESLVGQQARVGGEVQLTLDSIGEARNDMHYPYDVQRADTDMQLYTSFAGVQGGGETVEKEPIHLWHACFGGQIAAARNFLAAGADVNQRRNPDNTGNTALGGAVENNHPDIVGLLVGAGADADRGDSATGMTPLIISAEKGHTEIVKQLVTCNATVDMATPSGVTPLLAAVEKGHTETVKLLLAARASVNKKIPAIGATPLLIATMQGYPEIVSQLIAASVTSIDEPMVRVR
jgi:ankyrin repeat protein